MKRMWRLWRRFMTASTDASGLPDCGTDAGWSDYRAWKDIK